MANSSDIEPLILEILATGITIADFCEWANISVSHFGRARKEPLKWPTKVAQIKLKGEEYLEVYKQNRLQNPPTIYNGKVHNNDTGNLNARFNHIEFSIDGLNGKIDRILKERKQEKAFNNRLIERDKAVTDYLISEQTPEDKKILASRFEEIERIYNMAMAEIEKEDSEQFTPPDRPTDIPPPDEPA